MGRRHAYLCGNGAWISGNRGNGCAAKLGSHDHKGANQFSLLATDYPTILFMSRNQLLKAKNCNIDVDEPATETGFAFKDGYFSVRVFA